MTIEFFTGFEGCGATAQCAILFDFAGIFTYSATGGWANGKSITTHANPGWLARKNVAAGKTKVAGWHIRGATTAEINASYVYPLVSFRGPDIRVFNTAAGLRVTKGTTQIGSTVAVNVTSALTHVEVKCFSDATAGTLQVKINGVLVADLSGLDTDGSDITSVHWGCTNVNNGRMDNVFAATDWKGELKSVLLLPASDTAVQFTPNAGADNFSRINQTASDGDTTYVSSGTVGHKDIYGYDQLASGLVPLAATFVTTARKDDTGVRSLKSLAVQDATTYDQASAVLGEAYPALAGSGMVTTLPTAPDGSPWSRTILNGMNWGFEVTA